MSPPFKIAKRNFPMTSSPFLRTGFSFLKKDCISGSIHPRANTRCFLETAIKSLLLILLFITLITISSKPVQAADLVISGDPIRITADEYGSMYLERKDSATYVKQYFQDSVSFLFLNESDLAFDSHDPATIGGGYANTRFTPVSHTKPNDWTITTVYAAGSTGVQITRTITYTNGENFYLASYAINNGGATTYSNVKLRYGGDTYFAGDDSSVGNYNSTLKMVYLTNPDPLITWLMGAYGSLSDQADHYYEALYTSFWTALGDKDTPLPDTVSSSDIDAGYGLERARTTLAPGDTWTVEVFEKWMTEGHVRVMPPNGQSNRVTGDALQYQFTIQNYQTSDDTFNLTLSSSNGWSTNLPGGSSVAVSATSSQTVTAEVTIAAGTAKDVTDTLTLTATSQADNSITHSGSATTTVLETTTSQAGPPVCQDTAPGITPNLFQIDVNRDSAILYFSPVNQHLSYYYIAYGLHEGDVQFGVEFPATPSNGVESYTIGMLNPNTDYYFKVRGGNGCAPGGWSNVKSAKTTGVNSPPPAFNELSNQEEIVEIAEPMVETLQPNQCNHTVQSGDNLWNIAKEIYGGGNSYPLIIKHNEKKYPTIAEELAVGWELSFPCGSEEKDGQELTYDVTVQVEHRGSPLAGATVELNSDPRTGVTGENGVVAFQGVEKGEHTLKIAYQNYTAEQKLMIEGDKREFNVSVNVDLKKGNSILSTWAWFAIIVGICAVFVISRKRKNGR